VLGLSAQPTALIAKVFYACKMTEMWGRGTEEMIELCQKAGYPEVQFSQTMGSFTVSLPFKESIARLSVQSGEVLPLLTVRQKQILEILSKTPTKMSAIRAGLENPPTPRMVQIDLIKLKEAELVESQGGGRSLVWCLKYPSS
jgi:ATP-dependent DNA helicase RecG